MGQLYNQLSLGVVSLCLTLTCAMLSNIYLSWLYPFLKTLKEDNFLPWLPVTVSFIVYLLDIWRGRFAHYGNYIESVISYIQKEGQVHDNLEDNIAIIYKYNQEHGKPKIYRHNHKRSISDGKYNVQGFIIFISSGNTYIPTDLFYELIKIPGAPGPIWSVVKSELFSLLIRCFPALFIFWLCQIIHLVDMQNYQPIVKAVISLTFVTLYKGLFLHRSLSPINVATNVAMQREVNKLLKNFKTWAFITDEEA